MPESTFTPDLAAEICRRVASGEPLRQVCRDPGMPPESTVRTWALSDFNGFAAVFHEAKRLQVEAWSDEIVLIANRDDLEPNDKRVRIQTLQWLASKLFPKKYGDRLLMSGDPDAPVRHLHEHQVQAALQALTPPQLQALENFCRSVLETPEGHT